MYFLLKQVLFGEEFYLFIFGLFFQVGRDTPWISDILQGIPVAILKWFV